MLNKLLIVILLSISSECFCQDGLTLKLNMDIDSTYYLEFMNDYDSLICILVSPFYSQDKTNHFILHEDNKFHLTYTKKDQFIEGAITPFTAIYLLPKDSLKINLIFQESSVGKVLEVKYFMTNKKCLKKMKKKEAKRNWYTRYVWRYKVIEIK